MNAAVACQSCGASLKLVPGLRTVKCPYCASPAVVERPAWEGAPTPSFVLAFNLGRDAALAIADRWKRSRGIFTHSGIRGAPVEDVRGVYLPGYLYGAVVHAQYQASIGENYTVTYTETDSQGRTVTRTRTETEWRPLAGQHSSYVRDIIVTASRGVHNMELEQVEPFDLRQLRRYTPAALSGWLAEEPSMTLPQCMEWARAEAQAHVGRTLAAFMPGDRHSDLTYRSWFENEILDHLLVPLWVLAVRYDPKKPPVRILINGQTGKAYGQAPRSWIKIAIAVGAALAVVAIVILGLVLAAQHGGAR